MPAKIKVLLRVRVPVVQRAVYPNHFVEDASPCYDLNTKNLRLLNSHGLPNVFLGESIGRERAGRGPIRFLKH